MAVSAAHCFLRRAVPPPPPTPPCQARHRSHPHPVPPFTPSQTQPRLPPALPAGIEHAVGRHCLLKGGAATVGGGETARCLRTRPLRPGCRRSCGCCGAAGWAGLVHVGVAIDLAAFRVRATITSPRFVRDLRDTPAARIAAKLISRRDAKPFDLHGRGARSAATTAEQPISMPTGVQRNSTRLPPFHGDCSVRRSNASDRVPGIQWTETEDRCPGGMHLELSQWGAMETGDPPSELFAPSVHLRQQMFVPARINVP